MREGPQRATKMTKILGSLPCEQKLGELGLFTLEERRLRGDPITMFHFLKGGYKEDRDCFYKESHEKYKG